MFSNNIAHGDFKDLTRRRTFDRAFNIAQNPKYYIYPRGLAFMAYKFFDEKTFGETIKNEIISNEELAEEFLKPSIRKLKKRKLNSSFMTIFGVLTLLICN